MQHTLVAWLIYAGARSPRTPLPGAPWLWGDRDGLWRAGPEAEWEVSVGCAGARTSSPQVLSRRTGHLISAALRSLSLKSTACVPRSGMSSKGLKKLPP